MMAGMWMNSRDMLWMIRLYFVGDATKANGPSANVAACIGWIVVTYVAPNSLYCLGSEVVCLRMTIVEVATWRRNQNIVRCDRCGVYKQTGGK